MVRLGARSLGVVVVGLGLVTPAWSDRCEDLLKLDGLLSRAARECPFSFYSFRFRQDAQLCADKVGEKIAKPLIVKGQQAFDARAREMGKEGLCRKLLGDFPMTVKP